MNDAQLLSVVWMDRDLSRKVHVSLICATTIPSRGGHFLKAQVDGDYCPGDHLVFELQNGNLEPMASSGVDSLLTVHKEGTVLIPVQNLREVVVPNST